MSPILESQRVLVSGIAQAYGICDVGYQGLFFDEEWGEWHNRTRPYHSIFARFPVRDLAGYADGMSLYEVNKSSPVSRLDAFGNASGLCCGPETTTWLKTQMRVNALNPFIKKLRVELEALRYPMPMEGSVPYGPYPNMQTGGGTLGLGVVIHGSLVEFRDHVKRGGPWDFATTITFETASCPCSQCKKTVTLCDLCLDVSTIGNIHYGFVGRAAGIDSKMLFDEASKAAPNAQDFPHAHAEIQLGIDLWGNQDQLNSDMGPDVGRLCDLLKARRETLRITHKTRNCEPCSEKLPTSHR